MCRDAEPQDPLPAMAHNRSEPRALSNTDILIKPDIPPDLGFTSWDRHNEIFLHAYRATAAWIRRELAEPDSKVQAVIGTR